MSITRKLEARGINPRLALPIALLLATTLAAWALMASGKRVMPNSIDTRPLPIDAFAVSEQNIELKVYTQGTIEPRTQSDLVSEVAGTVSWVAQNLVAGGRIESGQALLKLDAADYQTDLVRAQASLARRKAELERTDREQKRITKLQNKKLASQAQLDNAASDYSVASANFAEAKANVQQAKRDIKRTVISAPYDGLVRSKSIDVGQYVGRGTKIASVYATDYLEVRLPIADSELAFIEQDKLSGNDKPSVILSADYAGVKTHWRGVIDRLEAAIDTRTRMVFAVARVQVNKDSPPPVGLFVKAEIAGRVVNSVTAIPRAALRDNNQVLVVNENKVLESRKVSVLRIEGERLILNSGLNQGDIVSTSLSPTLSPGSLVAATVRNQQAELTLDEGKTDRTGNNPD